MPYLTDMFHDQNRVQPVPTAAPSPRPAGAFDPDVLADRLNTRIVGQRNAIDAVVRAVSLASVGANDPSRPLANVLLAGPTGVGKTELVRQVAAELRSGPDDMCRIDMNALAQEHYAASFSGAPPGYAGSKESFTLFDRGAVEGDPYTPGVVLFDEVEKADTTVLRALLQILDHGELRLANGQQSISFRNCYVFMTSNLGSAELAARRRSPRAWVARRRNRTGPRADDAIVRRAIERFFDPEFFNRLDETVVMNGFDDRTAHEVTGLEIDVVTRRLARRSVTVHVGPDVVEFLRRRGFDPVYGARGLRRTVRTALADPLAAAVLQHRPVGTEPLALAAGVVDGRIRVSRV